MTPNQELESPQNFFNVKFAKKLQASDLLELRAQERFGFREDIYLEREEVDLKIHNLIQKQKNIIISGKPLTGKSRAILEQLKENFPESTVYLANKNLDINIYQVEALIKQNMVHDKCFYIFNDIDNFINKNQFNNLIEKILSQSQNNIIIASCRTIYLKSVFDNLGNELQALFSTIQINPLNEELRKKLNKLNINRYSLIKDDTIGSYFFPLSEMKSRYENLELNRENDKNLKIQYEFLRSYRCIEIWRRSNRGAKDIIIQYAQKRLLSYYPQKLNISLYEWEKSIERLVDLGFIKYKGEKITIEPVYVERIIANNESEENFIFEIIKYYPTVENATKLIRRVSTNKLAWQLYNHIRNIGIKPNCYLFNSLLIKTENQSEISDILNDMKQNSIEPDEFTFNILINKKDNFNDSWQLYQEMLDRQIKPSLVTFNTLIKKANTFENSWPVYQKLLETNIEPTKFTFYSLISQASNFKQAIKVFRSYCSFGFELDIKFIGSTLGKLHLSNQNPEDFNEDIKYVHEQMFKFNIVHTSFTLKILIASMPDFESAWNLYQEVVNSKRLENFSPTIFTQLIDKAETYDQVSEPFSEMMKKVTNSEIGELTINPFNKLIEKAPDFQRAWSTFEDISRYQISYDNCTFENLMRKTNSIEDRDKVLEKSKYTYKNSINKLNKIFAQERRKHLYERLKKSNCFDEAIKIYKEMLALKIHLSPIIFLLILNKIDRVSEEAFNEAMYVHNLMCKQNIAHNSYTLNRLLKFTPDFDTAWALYQAIERDKRINIVSHHIFITLISKANKNQKNIVFKMVKIKYPELVNMIENEIKPKRKNL